MLRRLYKSRLKLAARCPVSGCWPCYCGQTAGCIKIPLAMELGLGPGHIVLDGDPALNSLPKKGQSPFLLWPNGWIHQDATWYGGRHQPRGDFVRWRPSPLHQEGQSPQFSAHIYCAKRLHGSRCHLLWPPYVIGGPLYFCPVVSFLLPSSSSSSSFFSSPNLSGRRSDVCHTSTHGVALVRI